VVWDVTPFEDAKTKAASFQSLATALNSMRTAGFKLDPKAVRRMIRDTIPGFDPGKIEEVPPVQIEAQAARAGASVLGDEDGSPSPAQPAGDMPKARIAALGARFDPRMLTRVRVHLSEDEEVREAMADIDAAHADMRRRVAR
jgi:hypothetical protein